MKKLIILGLLSISVSSFAQLSSLNTNSWAHLMSTFSVSPKSSVSFETAYRMANFTEDFQQFFVRPSYDYKLKRNLTASIGYTYVLTGVYGNPALNKTNMPENHVWIQGNLQNKIGKVSVNNRLRNENRFVGLATAVGEDFEINDYAYRNRMRYMLMASLPLIKLSDTQSLNGFVANEIFLNVGKNAGATLLNQNRAMAGLGYRLNPAHQIQVAYIFQNIWNHPNTIREDNSTVRLSYVTNLKLYKDKKPVFTPKNNSLAFKDFIK
jgi:hypothetical protein